MTYNELSTHAGEKADIQDGKIVLNSNGFLTLSRTPGQNVAYINDTDKTVTPIVPITEYRGHVYKLRARDCVSLVGRWLDDNFGLELLKVYTSAPNAKFAEYYFGDFSQWFIENGFHEADTPQHGDVIFYGTEGLRNHLGIYLEGGQILHHIPRRYSCIDTFDDSLVKGVYRHANANAQD